ncbi:LLM class flavin-dependent oxidoreductase [Paenibacillus guangzhouensis]|uniref:LLM class flavin-dependent oxidoreductase n=1 Tax=Paenibacillus guangzhouensis TaxID=1473112 RepID=UPI001267379A|nr:LLM class flavin-dependent oxidoreductase [Paenibacillus guangzhouensis]
MNMKDNGVEPTFEFGLYTLGDLSPDIQTGKPIHPAQRLRDIVEAAKLADEAGIDVFGVGEHHRLDFALSSPPVVLAAIAQATKHIRLTSATTVLSTADPVRVFEDFATLDLLSNGRAEIISGRGAFLESFPLFGYAREDYHALFQENLTLLQELNRQAKVTWKGAFRSDLEGAEIAPRPVQPEIPLWIGVGGTPASAALAGTYGTGMALAILGGDPSKLQHIVETYRQAGEKAGHDPRHLQVGITSHGYIAKTTEQAMSEFYPYYANYTAQFNGNRLESTTLTREAFEQLAGPETALAVGSPERIAEKILTQHQLFGHTRYMMQMDIGGVPFNRVAKAIELLATEVAPIVRRELRKQSQTVNAKA